MFRFGVCVQANRWRKRGVTMNGIKHGLFWEGTGYPAHVSIYARDGTVAVLQPGVEMGQGLFTKVTLPSYLPSWNLQPAWLCVFNIIIFILFLFCFQPAHNTP